MNPDDLIAYQNAIKSIESSGGNYGLMGPATRNGDRAYGAYQVMGSNIPDWTKKHYGTALSPEEFLKNKDAQDAVFNGQFGGYVGQYGNPQDAASAWFTGRPQAQGGGASDGNITGNQYVDKFNKYLGQPMAFAGDDDGSAAPAAAARPTGGALSFGGDDGDNVASRSDNRLSIGSLFGASDATNAKLHGIGAQLTRAAAALSSGVNPAQSGQLNAAAKAAEDANQPNMQYVMGPNGQLIRINKDTGEASFATLPGGGKGNFGVVMGKDAQGNPVPVGKIDHNTGDYTPYNGGTAGQSQKSAYGEDVTQDNPYGLPGDIEGLKSAGAAGQSLYNQLQGIKSGNIQYPTGSRVNKQMEQLRNAAAYYFPDLNANDFAARKRYQEENVKQTPGSIGGNKIALNHSYNVLGQISDKMVALNNSDNGYIPAGIQGMYNSAKNQRPANHAAANSLDTQLMPALAGETGKLYYGQGAGGQAEREKISKGLTSYGTKQDQISGLETALNTLQAREDDIDNAARQAYGKDWEKYSARSDAGHKDIEKLKRNIGILKGELNKDGTPKSIPQAAAPQQSSLPQGWNYLGSK